MLMYILTLNFGRDARALARQNKKSDERRAEKTDGRREKTEGGGGRRHKSDSVPLSRAPLSATRTATAKTNY